MMDTCPDMDLLQSPDDHRVRAHLVSCETCIVLVELARASRIDDAGDASDDCNRAEPLIAVMGSVALDRADGEFLETHLGGCTRCLSALAMTLASDEADVRPHADPLLDPIAVGQWSSPMPQTFAFVRPRSNRWKILAAAACLIALVVVVVLAVGRTEQREARREPSRATAGEATSPAASPPPVRPASPPNREVARESLAVKKGLEKRPAQRVIETLPKDADDASTNPDPGLPERPSRADISQGIGKVKGQVLACSTFGTGFVKVKIKISPDGGVTSADTTDGSAALRDCVLKAIKQARFVKSRLGITVNYPFKLE